MEAPGTNFEPVSLGNVADGELERQFMECINKVVEAFNEPAEYEPSGNMLKCSVSLGVTFQKHLETGAVLVAVSAAFKPPKRRAAVRAAFISNGVVLVEDAEQLGLLEAPSNVTPIEAAAQSGDED